MATSIDSGKPTNPAHLVLEAWSQGIMVGSLIVMAMITTANMRAGVLLHKLVLLEVCDRSQSVGVFSMLTGELFEVGPCRAEWILHIFQPPGFWVVPFVHGCLAY